jgi:hypothetical protein
MGLERSGKLGSAGDFGGGGGGGPPPPEAQVAGSKARPDRRNGGFLGTGAAPNCLADDPKLRLRQ